MPALDFPYQPIFPGGLLRPMVKAVALNILNGRTAEFVGLLDTGADQTSLTQKLLGELGINPSDLEDDRAETPVGGDPIKLCDFLQIGILHENHVYFPNGDHPVPAHFSKGATTCLIGQKSFLRHCVATFDGPRRIVTIDF